MGLTPMVPSPTPAASRRMAKPSPLARKHLINSSAQPLERHKHLALAATARRQGRLPAVALEASRRTRWVSGAPFRPAKNRWINSRAPLPRRQSCLAAVKTPVRQERPLRASLARSRATCPVRARPRVLKTQRHEQAPLRRQFLARALPRRRETRAGRGRAVLSRGVAEQPLRRQRRQLPQAG